MSRAVHKYNVGILTRDNEIRWVTSIDNKTHSYFLEDGKPAMNMAKCVAESVVVGARFNLNRAIMVKVPTNWTDFENDTRTTSADKAGE